MFKRLLICNRGEVALRIIRACRELNIESVIVYSTSDKDSLPVSLADKSICIGPGRSNESYLNIPKVLNAGLLAKVDAIHPGYGFLSESPEFVDLVEKCQLKFVGPSKGSIQLLGNKSRARSLMIDHNIPVVPGSSQDIEDIGELRTLAGEIGYPVIIKATSGGGGRGMRIVHREEDLEREFLNAKSEAHTSFGDSRVYLEKYIIRPRHIEVQILADDYGNVIHLGERDCSLQRRNQKILEETPSPGLDSKLRESLGKLAIKIARISNYKNAGTVEFILDEENNFYFLEMNTRLQVEHTITEMVTGIDLVKEQIKIASGMRLSYDQEDIKISGHSIECRINGEDIYENFLPSIGRIEGLNIPNGFNVRFDSHIYSGYEIPPYYDSLLGKLVVKGENRLAAIRKMRASLEELKISGLETNIDLHYGILHDLDFVKGRYDTGFLDEKLGGDFKEFLIRNGERI